MSLTTKEYYAILYKTNREQIIQGQKKYRQSEQGRKAKRMSNWRQRGVNNVNDKLYDYYLECSVCEVCGDEFRNSKDKHLDHDHKTGDFRFVLCQRCNVCDRWKNKI
jgi:hypothetical protein